MNEYEQQVQVERYREWCAERDAQEEQQYHIYLQERIVELEAENRIFRSTESVDDSVWDALLEQVRTFQAKLDRVCEWKPMPTGVGHSPGCGKIGLAFASLEIHKFCPFCGGKIVELKSALGDEE
jgi:hypothetical protein